MSYLLSTQECVFSPLDLLSLTRSMTLCWLNDERQLQKRKGDVLWFCILYVCLPPCLQTSILSSLTHCQVSGVENVLMHKKNSMWPGGSAVGLLYIFSSVSFYSCAGHMV